MYIWDIFLEMLFSVAQPLAGISSIPSEFPNARLRKKSNESKEWSIVGLAECCRDETSDVEGVNMPSFQPLKRPLKQLVYRFICMIHDQKSSIWFIFRFKDTMFVWSRDKCPYSTWDSSSIILHSLHEFAWICGELQDTTSIWKGSNKNNSYCTH